MKPNLNNQKGRNMKTVMKDYLDRIIMTSRECIRFPSVEGESEVGYPFGRAVGECLKYFLDTAASFGFETHNYDNYIGEVVYGEGEDFAILAHLDVVPAGDGWHYPPFDAVMNDDVSAGGTVGEKIWGRGALDDKTPAVIILYALLALKDKGIMPSRRFRLILGCNEETGWRCIDHYKSIRQLPREGFTPDADFPAIYAEKGIAHIELEFDIENAPFTSLTAGTAINMVPALARATLKEKPKGKLPNGLTLEGYELSAHGKSAHGSTPECGTNALGILLSYLALEREDIGYICKLLFGGTAGLTELSDKTGRLTLSPDLAEYSDGVLRISLDIRYPATLELRNVNELLDRSGVRYKLIRHTAPLYNDPKGELITTLTQVYSDITGDVAEPIAIGGGTYARALEGGVAFGPELRGTEITIHQPDEFITVEHIELLSDIYYTALERLSK